MCPPPVSSSSNASRWFWNIAGAREDHLHDLLLHPNVQYTEEVPVFFLSGPTGVGKARSQTPRGPVDPGRDLAFFWGETRRTCRHWRARRTGHGHFNVVGSDGDIDSGR